VSRPQRTSERELHLLACLEDAPFDRRERHLERVGDLVVGQPDDVAQQQRHLEVRVEFLHRPPDRIDRLGLLTGLLDGGESRQVLKRAGRLGAPLAGAQLVEHAVLGHLEKPACELAAKREARQRVVDAHEDLLGEVLGERVVAGEPEDVVVHRRLVAAHQQREGALVTALGLAENGRVGLRDWQRT
jgi:hypothetical protein